MPTDDRREQETRDPNAPREREGTEEKRETGIEYGANEAEQTRERERAPYDKTDEIGEITETELP
jgi:hypothetical protein